MTSARLFSEKLNNLEKEFRDFAAVQNRPLTINSNIEHRLSDCENRLRSFECLRHELSRQESRQDLAESKINELIEQITPILTSHADALKEILATVRAPARQSLTLKK